MTKYKDLPKTHSSDPALWDDGPPKIHKPPYIPRRPDGRVDIDAMNAMNCPDVDHGGREEDCQDNDEGA